MAIKTITWQGILLRFAFAVVLVFSTYNPEGYSFYDWVIKPLPEFNALKIFVTVVLLILWTIYLRATFRSLGAIGLILALAFFGTLIWLLIDMDWIPTDSVRAVSYITLFVLCGVLTVGISWSHIRRRISGQLDVDDVEAE